MSLLTCCYFTVSSKLNELALDSKSQIQISEQSNVADVVILFEETLENQKPFSDVLKPFMEKINKMFNDKGMRYLIAMFTNLF